MNGLTASYPATRRVSIIALWALSPLLATLAAGCAHHHRHPHASGVAPAVFESPYVGSQRALDPADPKNWPAASDRFAPMGLFASFIRHAETSPGWLLLELRGEAIFVRAHPRRRTVVFEEGSNKIVRMDAYGGVEALSLRQYTGADSLSFDLEAAKLVLKGGAKPRHNPQFLTPTASSPK